jgi:hypothetical protein
MVTIGCGGAFSGTDHLPLEALDWLRTGASQRPGREKAGGAQGGGTGRKPPGQGRWPLLLIDTVIVG